MNQRRLVHHGLDPDKSCKLERFPPVLDLADYHGSVYRASRMRARGDCRIDHTEREDLRGAKQCFRPGPKLACASEQSGAECRCPFDEIFRSRSKRQEKGIRI
jgi:hypothetical protein